MSKLLTVFGATGNQGGSVVKAVLAHPELSKTYKIRAITRDTSKPNAVALKEKGAEVVTADMNDKESLKKAIEGSSVVFGVTNFWETMDPAVEISQGKNLADAALAAKVDRFIFSSLANVSEGSKGANTRVKHFDSKAQVEAYARSIGVPSTFYMPGLFMPMLLSQMNPNDEGVYTWTSPLADDARIPLLDPAGDTGKFVSAILLNLDKTLGQRILGTSGYVSPKEAAAQFSEVTGEKAQANRVPYDVFKGFLPPNMAEELTANMELIDSPGYYVGEPEGAVEQSVKLVNEESAGVEKLTTWKAFVKANFQKK